MASARIFLPPKLVPVFTGEAMFRGAYGGRGSAKTRSFAKMTAVGDDVGEGRARGDYFLRREYGIGARADAVSSWIAQFVGQKINVLDYYEAQGQPLSVHLQWMRDRGWGKAWVILPA